MRRSFAGDRLGQARTWAWPPLAYLALAVILTWPLTPLLGTALTTLGDPQQQTWILAWIAHAWRTNPAGVWDAPIFHPYPDTLAYHDSHLVLALVGAPIIWATGNPLLAHNALVLLSLILTGWAVFGLARDISRSEPAAFVAGAAVAFSAYQMAHIHQLNLLQTAWLPWALLWLRRLLRPAEEGGGRLRQALLLALFVGLQCVTAFYYGFFAAVVLGGYVAWWALTALWGRWRRGGRLPWRQAGMAAGGLALGGLLAVPFLLPYLGLYGTLGIVRTVRELDNWSAPLGAYASVPAGNLLHRLIGWPPVEASEMVLYPGLLLTLMGAFAALAALRRPDRERLYWIGLGLVAVVLSFGTGVRLERGGEPLAIPVPYPLLYGRVPGFGSMRVPARWGMLLTLALAVLAALALAWLLPRLRRRWRPVVTGLALGAVLFEQAIAPLSLPDPAPLWNAPPVYAWLGAAEQADVRVALELPLGRILRGPELNRATWRHYYSLHHWKALPVAYGALIPIGATDIMGRVQRLPEPEALRGLQLLGVDTLVVHTDELSGEGRERLLGGLDESPLVRPRATVGSAAVFTVLPDADLTALAATGRDGASIFVSGDERGPGVLALALARRWAAEGFAVYGPARIRYYGPLATPRPGGVFAYGLLAADEDPAALGFDPAGLRWRSNGFAFYAADPALQVNLALAQPVAGAFHPRSPADLEIAVEPERLRAGPLTATWTGPLAAATLEIDAASLTEQRLTVGGAALTLPPGRSTVVLPVAPGQTLRLAGAAETTAWLRLRLRAGSIAVATVRPGPAGLVGAAAVAFDGGRLQVTARAAGGAALRLEVIGAAAYDDRPVRLATGGQPVGRPDAPLGFEIDLLRPAAPWLATSEPPVDGRYIAYLKDAAAPAAPGLPVATFTIRGGALADPVAVPLPLTTLR